jgi:hypothetical protein
MKKLILASALALPLCSCTALDKALGLKAGEPDRSEETIQAGEAVIRTTGDILIPGVGGALAVLFGLGARTYIKSRKKAA